jgi:ubiquinone/menaquinone biosynthesis C-methylase UbiE
MASVAKLPVCDCLFDLVFSMNCLEFVQDREGALKELFRVATPGATAIFGVLNSRSLWELGRRLRRPFSFVRSVAAATLCAVEPVFLCALHMSLRLRVCEGDPAPRIGQVAASFARSESRCEVWPALGSKR